MYAEKSGGFSLRKKSWKLAGKSVKDTRVLLRLGRETERGRWIESERGCEGGELEESMKVIL